MSPRTALLILTALLAGCSRHESPIPLTPNCAGHGAIGTVVLIGAGDVRRGDVAFEPEERSGATGYVEAFDIEVWDPADDRFVQLGRGTQFDAVAARINDAYGPRTAASGANWVFDTGHPSFWTSSTVAYRPLRNPTGATWGPRASHPGSSRWRSSRRPPTVRSTRETAPPSRSRSPACRAHDTSGRSTGCRSADNRAHR